MLLTENDAKPLAIMLCFATEPCEKAADMSSMSVQVSTPLGKEDNHRAKKNTTQPNNKKYLLRHQTGDVRPPSTKKLKQEA